jgi:uncharacterized peroxidase-related enzyme
MISYFDGTSAASPADLIDHLAALMPGSPMHALRHQRDKVALATQASLQGLFDPRLPGLGLDERLAVALYACRISNSPTLATFYREQLIAVSDNGELLQAAQSGADLTTLQNPRLGALLRFAHTLITEPIKGDQTALARLPEAGLSMPAVVAFAQLVAFLSYQIRLYSGVSALAGSQRVLPMESGPARAMPSRSALGQAMATATTAQEAAPIRIQGFTNQTLEWRAWLPKVNLDEASVEQLAVLEESHPKAKVSDYYLFLVHQPEILRQRSLAFNAIMYAPGGMSRAERELGATVVSRINGCVYCAAVHAQRFEQMAKRQDVIREVFENPFSAGTDARERAICEFSAALTLRPDQIAAPQVERLFDHGLTALEVLDLIHSVAIFAWANRLMLNLGEPVY